MDPEKIKAEDLNGIYGELAEILGIETVLKIHASYRGQAVCFPVELFSRDFIAKQIMDEFDGHNIKKLATKFGYSEKWIRNIIKNQMQ
ncbi:MAG: Mor transcription activator family protein [Clostridia bacterium]|nr:Mor transcription activator family protein [Clostridia bacterium]